MNTDDARRAMNTDDTICYTVEATLNTDNDDFLRLTVEIPYALLTKVEPLLSPRERALVESCLALPNRGPLGLVTAFGVLLSAATRHAAQYHTLDDANPGTPPN